jgi:hypothetical protein
VFLRPFVVGLIHAADARQLLGDLQDAVDAGLEEGRSGFVLLSRSGVIEHASPTARALLEQWFRELETALPTEIAGWLRRYAQAPSHRT